MVAEFERTTLGIRAYKAGNLGDLANYLIDMEYAYNSILIFQQQNHPYYYDLWDRRAARRIIRIQSRIARYDISASTVRPEQILPRMRIELNRVVINSPGFWEFIGSMNPLQQLREYLKDRHERVKDTKSRSGAEHRRLDLENELLEKQIYEKGLGITKQKIDMMRDIGFTNEQIQQHVWVSIGEPLSRLGRHQDRGLIGPPVSDALDD